MFLMILPTFAASPPIGLCESGERVRIACVLQKERQVAVCQRDQTLVYRFGKPGAIELQLPKEGGAPLDVAHRQLGTDSERHVVSAWNEGHRYAVHSTRTEDQFDVGLVVRKGVDDPLVTSICSNQLGIDLTETESFAADPKLDTSWIGKWTDGTTSLTITSALALEAATSSWVGQLPGQVHVAETAGALTRKSATTFEHTRDDCVLTLEARTGALWVEDNLKCGGLNARLMGLLQRVP